MSQLVIATHSNKADVMDAWHVRHHDQTNKIRVMSYNVPHEDEIHVKLVTFTIDEWPVIAKTWTMTLTKKWRLYFSHVR